MTSTGPAGALREFEPLIGLEIHARLATRTKLLCGCRSLFGAEPNTLVCPVCLGLPGALPRPNREAVRLAVRLALALGCDTSPVSAWARKSYFYPDLPKGYQITQHERPLAIGGAVRIEPSPEPRRWIPLERVHLEEDAGKLVHEGFPDGASGVDFNRCGQPLVEVVGEPALRSPTEASSFVERVHAILLATGVSDGEMAEGSLRCDANVSIRRPGEPRGARTEIKNLNSLRSLRRALEFEIGRQAGVASSGGSIAAETRSWDETAGETRAMRGKEDSPDYRYFPEPDLPPLVLDERLLREAAHDLPELPHQRLDRHMLEHGLSEADARVLSLSPDLSAYYERVVEVSGEPGRAAGWVLSELAGLLEEGVRGVAASRVAPERLAALIRMIEDGAVTGRTAKEVLTTMVETGGEPKAIVAERGLGRVGALDAIESACRRALRAEPRLVDEYRSGRVVLLDFFVGRVMAETRGRADATVVRATLVRLLGAPLDD